MLLGCVALLLYPKVEHHPLSIVRYHFKYIQGYLTLLEAVYSILALPRNIHNSLDGLNVAFTMQAYLICRQDKYYFFVTKLT
jgi:hypothetical protein